MELSDADMRILAAIEDGLPLVSRPFEAVGKQAGIDEVGVIERLRAMLEAGVIKRPGTGGAPSRARLSGQCHDRLGCA